MYKKHKGFTLIELLAVIIILAIIALIATPIVLNVIEEAKSSAGKSEANMILGGINNYCATEAIKEEMDENYTTICKNTMTEEEVKKMVNLGNAEILEIEYGTKLTWLKVKSNGIIYSLQDNTMIEGDFEKPNPSFAEDSWETIAENVKNGIMYSVGEEKEITLTGIYAGTYKLRIANNTTPEECEIEGFSQTTCGFVVEFVDIITTHNMNFNGTNLGGWPASEMYSFVNIDIYDALPDELKKVIIDTQVVSGHGSHDMPNFISNDKLYLLSPKEIYGSNLNSDSGADNTRLLDYYQNNPGKKTKNYKGSAECW